MKFILKNIYLQVMFIVVMAMFFILAVIFLVNNKKLSPNGDYFWTKGRVLSRVDYRIFACGEELFLKADTESPVGKEKGLFAKSEQGSIIADGTPSYIEDVSLSAFFNAVDGALKFSGGNENAELLRVPTESGIREFHSGDLCGGQKAKLYVLRYRVDVFSEPWSVYARILWKYPDYVLENNYSRVPPGDCLIFLFDSQDALERPWPRCISHENAIVDGKLILKE